MVVYANLRSLLITIKVESLENAAMIGITILL
jgi:hypothetical protein